MSAASKKTRSVDAELQAAAAGFVPAGGASGAGTAAVWLPWLVVLLLAGALVYVVVLTLTASAPQGDVVGGDGGERRSQGEEAEESVTRALLNRQGPATAQRRNVNGVEVLAVAGTVEPLGGAPLRVSAPVAGFVKSIAVRPGDTVIPGETVLMRLAAPALEAQLETQRAVVRTLQAEAATYEEEAQAAWLAEVLQAQRAAAEQASAAERRFEQARRGSPSVVAARELARLEDQWREAVRRAEQAQRTLVSRERELEREAQRVTRHLEQATSRLAQLEYEAAQLEVRVPRIRHPHGVERLEVAALHVAPGAGVEARTTVLVDLIAPDLLQVRAYLPVERAEMLRVGELVRRIRTRELRQRPEPRMLLEIEVPSLHSRRHEEPSNDNNINAPAADAETAPPPREEEEEGGGNQGEPGGGEEFVAQPDVPGTADEDGTGRRGGLERGFAHLNGRLRAPGLDTTLPVTFHGTATYHDETRNAYVLILDIQGSHDLLRPGMTVEVELPLERTRNR